MAVQAFVDESKRNGLVLVAAVIAEGHLAASRATMRRLRLPGQSRIHFTKEGHRRRREIAAAICRTGATVSIYDGTTLRDEGSARAACLEQIVADLDAVDCRRLVIEQDDAMLATDQVVLYRQVHKFGATLEYVHRRPSEEPLLWIADAVAWCWTRAGERHRIQPVVGHVWSA
jgi:hypothetical protein